MPDEDDWVVAELAAAKADILVDALAGTGFHGELDGRFAACLQTDE